MKLLAQIKRCLIVSATIGLLTPQVTIAGDRSPGRLDQDVALQAGGTLRGSVMSADGGAATGETISISASGEIIAETTVNSDGRFVMSGLRPGVYSIAVGNTQRPIRLWSPVAAPPSATADLRLIDEPSQIVRGIHRDYLPRWNHPVVVGGLLLTAGVIGGVIGYNIKDDAS